MRHSTLRILLFALAALTSTLGWQQSGDARCRRALFYMIADTNGDYCGTCYLQYEGFSFDGGEFCVYGDCTKPLFCIQT